MTYRNFLLVILVGALAPGLASAEVGLINPGPHGAARIIVQSGPAEPDPLFQLWVPLINLDSQAPWLLLNTNGDTNGDGEPSFGLSSQPGTPPTFTWAKKIGPNNHDPVYAQFVAGAWSVPIPIGTNPGDDLDPRWFQDSSGTIHAVWWRAGSGGGGGSVLYASCPAGSNAFTPEEEVSLPTEFARSPSLTVLPSGEVLVAYETDPVNDQRQVVVASKAGPIAAFQNEVIAITPGLGPLNPDPLAPEVTAAVGKVWVTWINSTTVVAYSERSSGLWTNPASEEPCDGPDDTGRARKTAQSRILSQ